MDLAIAIPSRIREGLNFADSGSNRAAAFSFRAMTARMAKYATINRNG